MSFAIAILALGAAGLALLDLLRLATGDRASDAALAWLVGSGAFAAAAPLVRFSLGIPLSRAAVLALVLAPPAVWGARWLRSRARRAEIDLVPGAAAGPTRPRWIPRPPWLFVPIAIYVFVVASATILHGLNTPTHTDDGVRVRAFAPMLAFADGWSPDARAVFSMAGALPTFVPALGWIATGTLDHFHVNAFVLTELVALLVLVVAVGSSRGSPERGWASALGLLSIPLFVYHCTSTYSDAVLAMRVGGGVLFALEYARTRERADAARALFLLGLAALVKREGELVAAAPAAVLVAQLAWERRRGAPLPWRALALLAVPVLLGALGRMAAVGFAGASPMLRFVAQQSAAAASGSSARPPGTSAAAAVLFFEQALFRSGNAGMIAWLVLAAIVVRGRALLRPPLLWPLVALAALLAEVAVSAIVLVPEYTLDGSTVHRALLVVSVPAALWVAAAVIDGVGAEVGAPAGAAAEGVTATRRRRPRPASRR